MSQNGSGGVTKQNNNDKEVKIRDQAEQGRWWKPVEGEGSCTPCNCAKATRCLSAEDEGDSSEVINNTAVSPRRSRVEKGGTEEQPSQSGGIAGDEERTRERLSPKVIVESTPRR
ncbi:hypothetical protein GG344DRAFT_68926 [Lentinula edodes]|nr:hypothetical protein GG344DRAFT_68926 [Lentinula edodes]